MVVVFAVPKRAFEGSAVRFGVLVQVAEAREGFLTVPTDLRGHGTITGFGHGGRHEDAG